MNVERLKILATFIRGQIELAHRPPVGCVQLNNEEAALCAEALEKVLALTLSEEDERDIGYIQGRLAVLHKDGRSYAVRSLADQALKAITRLKP